MGSTSVSPQNEYSTQKLKTRNSIETGSMESYTELVSRMQGKFSSSVMMDRVATVMKMINQIKVIKKLRNLKIEKLKTKLKL
jgi:hypothetical protein